MIKILLKQKNDSKAFIACEKWAELSPQNPRIFYLKGKINYRNHEFEEAMQMFIKVIEQNLNHYKALLYLGFIKQLWEQSVEDAITCFESVISNKFSSSKFRSRAYFGMSLIHQEMDLPSSIEYMILAIKFSPKDWQFKKNLANLYVKNKNFSKAAGVFKSILKESNEDLELLYSLATLYIIKEQYLKAMKYLMRVIELSGKQLEIRFEGVFANIFYSHNIRQSEMLQTSNIDFSLKVS
jgi:tetratricopeptide (TPR) repeat protein